MLGQAGSRAERQAQARKGEPCLGQQGRWPQFLEIPAALPQARLWEVAVRGWQRVCLQGPVGASAGPLAF